MLIQIVRSIKDDEINDKLIGALVKAQSEMTFASKTGLTHTLEVAMPLWKL